MTEFRGLLDIRSALRSSGGVERMLEAVAETTRRALGYRMIVVNVYRPAWDDFEVVVVLGGILSLDEPLDGRRPSAESLLVLEAVAAQTAMAMDMAAQAGEAARHHAAVEHLLRISVSLVGRRSVEETLGTVCEGIRDALRFCIVAAFLFDEASGTFRLTAESGLAPAVTAAVGTLPGELLMPLLDDPALDREAASCSTPPPPKRARRPACTASTSPSATAAARARGPATGCRCRCATRTGA